MKYFGLQEDDKVIWILEEGGKTEEIRPCRMQPKSQPTGAELLKQAKSGDPLGNSSGR